MTSRPNSYVPSAEAFRSSLGWAEPSDLVFLARQCLERGGFDHVLAFSEALAIAPGSDPALLLCRAVARFVAGEREAALGDVEQLLRTRPADLNALSVLAEMQARSGDGVSARRTLVELVERFPDYPGAQGALATLLMPGPHYREILGALHRALAPRAYLEIGVETGGTLALATGAEVAVGVDPETYPLEHALPSQASVVHETSDAFFANHTRQDWFGERAVDLTFIDGMHRFEFALRDFMNAEAWSSPDGTIVLHDCLPLTKIAAERERATRFWVGDTWKAVLALVRYRPDLKIRTLLTPPSGLVVVRRLDPASTLLRERYPAVIDELGPLPYPCASGEFPAEFSLLPATSAGLSEALR